MVERISVIHRTSSYRYRCQQPQPLVLICRDTPRASAMHIAPTAFPDRLNIYHFFRLRRPPPARSPQRFELTTRAAVSYIPISFWMTSSIVSSVEKRLLGMTRWARRSAFSSFALGLVCLAIFSPNGGILSPGAPPNQRNGPSERVSGSKNTQRIQAEGRSCSLTLAVTSDLLAPVKLDLSCMLNLSATPRRPTCPSRAFG